MKLIKRCIAAAALLCLLLTLAPTALAEENGEEDARFKDKSWDEVVEALLEKYGADPAQLGLGYYNTATGEEHYLNADQYMVAGSMFKVPLNMVFTERVYNGQLDWDDLIYGIRYSILLEDTIVNSNNDYAKILWQNAGDGSYHSYRRLIAPYMGEDPDTVDAKYYENNFFTSRPMISCLKLLYEQSERFPRLIETMLRAEPDDYFNYNEQQFDIAHKYGYYVEGDRLYMNDCGIAYTEEPILLVMFTDGVNHVYELMTEYCTLMCDYAQYHVAHRYKADVPEELAATASGTETAAASTLAATESEAAPAPEEGGSGLGLLLAGVGTVVLMVAAALWVMLCHKRHRIKALWAMLAVLFAGGAMLLSVIGLSAGTLIVKADGDPQQTVTSFMDALIAGDYDSAYAQLGGYSGLGLENQPSDQAGQLMYQALRESYSYELSGGCAVDKLSASQPIEFTYLDLRSIEQDVQTETMEQLNSFVQSRPRSQLYDSDSNYLPEVTQEAYLAAVTSVLDHAEDYYTTSSMLVELSYSDESWHILPGRELLKAITGGIY